MVKEVRPAYRTGRHHKIIHQKLYFMFKNYFKTALRSLWKNKVTSFINLFGLAVGMTAAVFIFLWVQNEMTVDNYHADKDNIFRITNTMQVSKNESWVMENSPLLMTDIALKEIPEVEKASRINLNTWAIPALNVNNKLFPEKTMAIVDKTWFNIFHYDFVAGNPAEFSKTPFSLILSESKAKKYFGNADAVGQIIRLDTINYTVAGVVKDNPLNSSFRFDIFIQLDGYLSNKETLRTSSNWGTLGFISFLQLRADADRSIVEKKLTEINNKNSGNNIATISLEPLREMYFENNLQNSVMPHGNKKVTYIFSLLGILLLITACINYVNLTTAKASIRAKEVSLRKITGAHG